MYSLIRRPLVSEKNNALNSAGVYVFEVDLKSDKKEIAAEVAIRFGVKVIDVNTQVCRGRAKVTKFGMGKTPRWKKALVRLAPGEKIALFEGA